jgi:WD40 repeat protein
MLALDWVVWSRVLRQIVLCVAVGGCGFQSRPADTQGPPPPDGVVTPGSDAASIDGVPPGLSGCLGRWLDGTLKLETPALLPKQSANNADERDPWVSSDGLTLYYSLDPNGASSSDIYRATRGAVTDAFGDGAKVTSLDSSGNDDRASLTADQKILALSSDRGGQIDIYMIDRSSTAVEFGPVDKRHLASIDNANTQHYDPFLTADGLTLYLSAMPSGQNQHIVFATRASVTADFPAAAPVAAINSAADADADPALSLDERIIVFSSTRAAGAGLGSTNLWYATRSDPGQSFSAPALIPMVNSNVQDGDPMLSADGCELYFASRRGASGGYDLYRASVDP